MALCSFDPMRSLGMRTVRTTSTLLRHPLGRSERPAAFQATTFMARRDESTEGAHSLRGKVAVVRFHLEKLPQRSSQEGERTAKAGEKRMR
jgi:hypothetical protein